MSVDWRSYRLSRADYERLYVEALVRRPGLNVQRRAVASWLREALRHDEAVFEDGTVRIALTPELADWALQIAPGIDMTGLD